MAKSGNVCLIRVSGAGGVMNVSSVDAERFTLGRVGADFVVNDKGVSRVHLTVHVKGRDLWLEDMNSTNGTFVGGTKLPPAVHVAYKPGTKVQLGLAGDTYTFEIAEKVVTQASAQEQEALLMKHPSRALHTPSPTVELAEQADKFLKEARETATGIKEAANREAELLVNNARNKANETITSARNEALALLDKARNSASQATLDRERAAETALSSARKEALEIKNNADEEAERVVKEARMSVAHVKLEAQKEAELILKSAREHADRVKDEADIDARELLKSTREKSRTILEQNEAEAEQAMQAARKAAAQVRAEADMQLEKARAYVAEKGATLLKEAEAQAAQLIAEAQMQASEMRANAKSDAQRAVDQALKSAERNVERIQEDAREKIQTLESEVTRLQFEVSSIEKRKREVIADFESVTAECEAKKARVTEETESLVARLSTEHEELKGRLKRDHEELNKKLTSETEAIKLVLANTQKTVADLQAEGERARANLTLATKMKDEADRLAKELREEREKSLIDFENRKKAQDQELANMKLRLLEDLKARQLEEEAKMHAIRGHQVTEMTRHLELVLVPLIQKQLGGQDATGAVTEFREAIGPVVKRVVFEEQSLQASSELEQVISSDPIIEKYKRRQKMRSRVAMAIPTIAFILAVFAPHVFEFARRPMDIITGGKSAAQLAAERRYKDINNKKRFNPPQMDQLGKTYTDSVLYTRNYVSKKLDDANRKRWSVELENFMFRELDLPEQIPINYIAVETRLIKELQLQRDGINPDFEAEGIARLRAIEEQTIAELKGKVGGDIAYDRVRAFERRFFDGMVLKAPASTEP